MTIYERIRKLRESMGMSQEELAIRVGYKSRSAINKIESGIRDINQSQIMAFAQALKTTPSHLMGWDDEESQELETHEHRYEKILNIPILGTIRAGKTIPVTDDYEGYLDLEEECQADFALRVIGDSMSWAGIHDGDTALVIHNREPHHGDIVAAGKADGDWSATLKFYIANNGTPCLRAANPDYPDIPISEGWTIVGVVNQIIKKAPGINRYQEFSTLKEDYDSKWNTVIETATEYGLDASSLNGFISAMHMMIKAAKK